jgi:phosphoenolpyruvate-protein phosphotransferase (PTS system enzyme I)
MSFTLHGIRASGGIAIGHAHLISHARLEVAHYLVGDKDIPAELKRFDQAVGEVRDELETLHRNLEASAPAELGAFLDVHSMILKDPMLSSAPRTLIVDRGCNAEWALVQEMDTLLEQFEKVDDAYLRERKHDVMQVVERVLKALLGHRGQPPARFAGEDSMIVVAHDLSPADMILFKQHRFGGFVTDVGGVTSHTAILARSLNLPAIVALHHARQTIREHEMLIVDGPQGVLIVNPDKQVLAEYRLRAREFDLDRQKLKRIKSTRAATIDGTEVELHANIELPQDVTVAKESGATGVGLFRTEFMFLNRDDLPDEEEQFEGYRRVAVAMDGLPVTIRTLDLGADKALSSVERSPANPALGLRAIRLCLAEPLMFLSQLRAILRASHYGNIRLLIPMLAHAHEIDQTLNLIAEAKATLDLQGQPYNRDIKVGGMIEIPAAALSLSVFLRKLDFLSIGTNDLIQYTLAIDRTDETVAHLYDPLHPAVLQLVAGTIQTANRANVPVAVCGEMAGDVLLTRLLLGFGLRQFSMHPAQLLTVKQQVLKTNIPDLQALAGKLLRADDPDKTRVLLERLNA